MSLNAFWHSPTLHARESFWRLFQPQSGGAAAEVVAPAGGVGLQWWHWLQSSTTAALAVFDHASFNTFWHSPTLHGSKLFWAAVEVAAACSGHHSGANTLSASPATGVALPGRWPTLVASQPRPPPPPERPSAPWAMGTNGDKWGQMGTNGDKWGQMGANGDAPVFFSKDFSFLLAPDPNCRRSSPPASHAPSAPATDRLASNIPFSDSPDRFPRESPPFFLVLYSTLLHFLRGDRIAAP